MNPLVLIPVVLLALATGFCRGVLEQIHPLNEDLRKMTIAFMYTCAAGLLVCVAAGVVYGR